ncbi:MAG TPA: redoxin domain-containing protein [Casimicrobiaceae bacterium]|jgi:thiol-disulfide isomerase/thioredoxin|nr:redoxin domain-containing protein [Casimicrobiaceae bacterium]
MTTLGRRHPFADRKGRLVKAGLVVAAVMILAASAVGVWVSLGPSGSALMPEVRSAADAQKKFVFIPHALPRPIANVEFEDGLGRKRALADFRGKVVLLNLWATWCGPCRKEMPTLDRLQSQLGGADFEVVALSIDRGGQAVVKSFFDEIGVRALAIYVDATAEAGTKLGILGVPTTLLLDGAGREIGRVTGPAEWDGPEVIDTIRRYLPPRP